ncbi:MAG: arsenite methyltransferase [Candidatus Bathyarchaeota archaeon]|nr:arsenite methyltransferase [Candidatus Bathyarchaeota archaeon]
MASAKEIKKAVKERYTAIAESKSNGCGCGGEESCCGGGDPKQAAELIGYNVKELEAIPQEAILGLGCGSPVAYVGLKPGETILDLGSGGGIDVFLAAKKVGVKGSIIGIDMNEAMIKRAREAANEYGFKNVDFRLGEIEDMPVEDGTIDAIISNCVINLSPDKPRVFREANRVLKPGGRITVSDIVTEGEIPEEIRRDLNSWASCVSGALPQEEYLKNIEAAGFKKPKILTESYYDTSEYDVDFKVKSITVEAYKP